MSNLLARKLAGFADLSGEDQAFLDSLCTNVRDYHTKRDLIKEGERPGVVFLLLEGWACRYKILANGKRQIMAYLLPGDLCDVHIFILKAMDHSMGALGPVKAALIPEEKMMELMETRPHLTRALWWATLVDEGVLREWLVNMGQRDAYDRIAHLMAELYLRLRAVGLHEGSTFDVPLTQEDLGDTMGLTPVHVNRVIQRMRDDGLIEMKGRKLHVPDIERLMAVSDFDSNYLHLRSEAK